ncbi:MAG TPA: hypothetical protein VGY57_05625, partial [Vicinamibacterales bacterium]|nr:hypothetical protein [Vicinamibacterales bacterium]
SQHRVLSDVLRRALAPTAVGGLIGIAIALALARTFRALLFGIESIDPVSLTAGAAALAAVALAAAAGPARRASRVEPASALRAD